MNERSDRIMIAIILIGLGILFLMLLQPIFLSVVSGLILAYVFSPVYSKLNKYFKSGNVSASIICALTILIVLLPIWFLSPIVIKQSFTVFQASQELDLSVQIQSLINSPELATQISNGIRLIIKNGTQALMNTLSDMLLNLPVVFLHIIIFYFTFFFAMRDGDKLINYIKSFSPFSSDVEKRFVRESKGITNAVIYGQIIIGTVQGILTGIGFYIFGVENALFMTLLAVLAGILPIVGPTLVFIPVSIFLLISGNVFGGIGVLIWGFVASWVDVPLRPIFVSRNSDMPPSLALIGMLGGFFVFGILGFVIGPLIVAYLMIILELFRTRN